MDNGRTRTDRPKHKEIDDDTQITQKMTQIVNMCKEKKDEKDTPLLTTV